MTIRLHLLGAVSALTFFASPALSAVETFDNAVVLSPTQAAGAWYTDRYAPNGFVSPVVFDGDNRLKQTISSADLQATEFYNTQGRKFDVNTTSASIQLYVPQAWSTTDARMASFWATGNGPDPIYPIIEFNQGGFRVWDSVNGWVNLAGAVTYDSWYTLSFAINGSNVDYKVGNLTASVDAYGATSLVNVMLQGHNTQGVASYDIYWDNLSTPAAVPEPATWALMIGGLALVGASMRRRKTTVAFA